MVLGVHGRNGVLVQKHVVKETKQENENVIILLHYLEEKVVMEMQLKLIPVNSGSARVRYLDQDGIPSANVEYDI